MASISMASCLLSSSASSLCGSQFSSPKVAQKTSVKMAVNVRCSLKEEDKSAKAFARRTAVAAVAMAALSLATSGIAKAEEEPKKGTPEAKKKYARVCVSMPTAAVCHY